MLRSKGVAETRSADYEYTRLSIRKGTRIKLTLATITNTRKVRRVRTPVPNLLISTDLNPLGVILLAHDRAAVPASAIAWGKASRGSADETGAQARSQGFEKVCKAYSEMDVVNNAISEGINSTIH